VSLTPTEQEGDLFDECFQILSELSELFEKQKEEIAIDFNSLLIDSLYSDLNLFRLNYEEYIKNEGTYDFMLLEDFAKRIRAISKGMKRE